MIDINELRQSLGAIQPEEVSELLDRLEAAEKERDALRAKVETAENDAAHQKALAASALRVAEGWERKCGELRAELETERTRLAACGVVALANTLDSAKQAREMRPEYWSASCGDVARMVDENIKLRAMIQVALLDRLEVAEKAVTEAYQRGYATGQEEIEKERDALRALVVMRFDHDYPPQFTQGHDLHELTEPVTAEHCRWFVAEIERLRTDCDALRAKIEAMERQEPVGEIQRANSTGNYICSEVWVPLPVGSKLYALPGAQPAPSAPDGFSREDLEAVADGLDGYEKTVNVGNVTGEGDDHLESTTAYAARFIRTMLAAAPEAKEIQL